MAEFFFEDHTASMANHFSALKRTRQTERRTTTNRANTSRFRTALRRFRAALQAGDPKAAQQEFRGTVAAIDKAAAKGVIHRNTASRYKARLNARLAAIGK
jgi:small subunit ribosomal protein S20